MYLFIFIIVCFSLNKTCISDLYQVDNVEKCCNYGEFLRITDDSVHCEKNSRKRLDINTISFEFLKRNISGNCTDVTLDGFFSFFIENGNIVEETPLDVVHFPKCCPLGYNYNKKIHSCVETLRTEENFIQGTFVKAGLTQCKLIVDEEINEVPVDIHLHNDTYCVDRDQTGGLIRRNCKYEIKETCEEIKCVKKCCPDGKSFVNGSTCLDTYVHGTDLAFSNQIHYSLGNYKQANNY